MNVTGMAKEKKLRDRIEKMVASINQLHTCPLSVWCAWVETVDDLTN